ncbi:MAG: GIY-YIG nuclease family protein, partial [Lishizhenia sp.]
YVYLLWSEKSNIHYVGMAKNVEQRLKDHNRGKSKFTKGHIPWKIIYSEGPYETKKAREIEKLYKTTQGKKVLIEKIS